jgi:hypothetical protein
VRGSKFEFLAHAAAAVGGISWILRLPNGRVLGRGPDAYSELEPCWRAVLRLQERVTDLSPVLSTAGAAGGWRWRLLLDGDPAAVSSRSYLRLRECEYSVDRFLHAVPVAMVVRTVRDLAPPPAV